MPRVWKTKASEPGGGGLRTGSTYHEQYVRMKISQSWIAGWNTCPLSYGACLTFGQLRSQSLQRTASLLRRRHLATALVLQPPSSRPLLLEDQLPLRIIDMSTPVCSDNVENLHVSSEARLIFTGLSLASSSQTDKRTPQPRKPFGIAPSVGLGPAGSESTDDYMLPPSAAAAA